MPSWNWIGPPRNDIVVGRCGHMPLWKLIEPQEKDTDAGRCGRMLPWGWDGPPGKVSARAGVAAGPFGAGSGCQRTVSARAGGRVLLGAGSSRRRGGRRVPVWSRASLGMDGAAWKKYRRWCGRLPLFVNPATISPATRDETCDEILRRNFRRSKCEET